MMSQITCQLSYSLSPEELERFDSFVRQSPSGTICQRPCWTEMVRPSRLQHYAYVSCRRGQQDLLAGVLRITRLAPGRYLGTFRRGPVVQQLEDFMTVMPVLQAQLRAAGICTLMMEPHWEGEQASELVMLLEQQHGFQSMHGSDTTMYQSTGIVDLRPDEESIYSKFRRTSRQDINRCRRDGLVIRMAENEQDVRAITNLYQKMASRRGFEILGQPEPLALWRVLGNADASFLVAEFEGKVIGGMISVIEGKRGHALLLASDPDTRGIDRSGPLYWESMRQMKSQGCEYFDLAGMSDPGAPQGENQKGNQRDQYKAKFRPRIETLVPTMVAPLHPVSHYALFGLRQSYRRSRLPQIIGPLLQR